jgi:hypothetical protein
MPDRAEGSGMTRHSTRREMICLGAAGVVGMVAGAARVTPSVASSSIAPLFREWWRLFIEITPASDAECHALVARASQIKDAIFCLPSVTAEDLAMKLLVELGNGDFDPTDEFLEEEIRPLAGVTGRSLLPAPAGLPYTAMPGEAGSLTGLAGEWQCPPTTHRSGDQ